MHEGLPESVEEQLPRRRGIHISWYVLFLLGSQFVVACRDRVERLAVRRQPFRHCGHFG